jgi:hypothetical protein
MTRMMMFDTLRNEWLELLALGKPGQKLVDRGPLHLYYGADTLGRPVFFLASKTQSTAPKLGDAVRVEHGQREDSLWTVVLTLIDDSVLDTFIGLCVELARRTSVAKTETEALTVFDGTIEDWRVILTAAPTKRLSISARRGLVAEVVYLLAASDSLGIATAVEAWTGPFFAPHDFRFSKGQVKEIKAVRAGANKIHISSVDQLDTAVGDTLELILVTLNDVPSDGTDSFTLIDLISRVRTASLGDPATWKSFEDKLTLASVEISDLFYSEAHFELGEVSTFAVTEGFPRIRLSSIPLGAIRTKYELELGAFANFEIKR